MSIGCENLQIGRNDIEIHLSEKASVLSNVYDALKDTELTEFRFFDDTLVKQAVYVISLYIGEVCIKGDVTDKDVEIDGQFQYRSIPIPELNKKIDEEEFIPIAGIALEEGVVFQS